ncbi:aminotransferase class I/II-fold pyridoxal phosphate-dependent enzyme [Paraflavisolibacter sp. H34]|uniref:trans-sulfuration enzyme family protein n=1 Tax=Huijunlia imazamoxiresistens TaxID=3127457 RepID=UPI0030175787
MTHPSPPPGPHSMGTACLQAAHAYSFHHAHLTPIFATATFTFDSAEQGRDVFSGKEPGYIYSRFGNPTVTVAEDVIARLEAFGLQDEEGRPLELKALLHASGQSALATLLLSALSAGDTVLSHYSLYGGSHELIYGFLPRFGIHSRIADLRDLEGVADLIRKTPSLKLIHVETPGNPSLQCIDLEAICTLARRHGLRVSVDNTFSTPYLQQPFRFGADFVVHSTTKFLNGHGTSIGGVLVGRDHAFMKEKAYGAYKVLGANANPFDAFLLLQGIKTLELRMEAHCRNAAQVAAFLCAHPRVERVHYNGLPSHPDYHTSQKQMRLPGSVLSFELKGGLEAGMAFMNRLQLCVRAVSLGTVDTLVSHPASMSHSGMSREDRLQSGITDGLIRMSVGIENSVDILGDLERALSGAGGDF